jgi:diguanylate cyclase (GGDEF)-like protein
MSKINQRQNFTTKLINSPVESFKVLFEATPVALVEGIWTKSFDVLNINQAAMALFNAQSEEQFIKGFSGLLSKIPTEILLELLSARVKGDLYETEVRLPTFQRGYVYVFMRLVYMPVAGEQPHAILAFHDITSYKRREGFLKKLSQMDGLTQVLNQSTIFQRLDDEISRAKHYQLDLTCILIDVDNFKNVNDTFGHLTGDKCLKQVATLLKNSLRKTDIVGRYGGDEFLVILTETKLEQAAIPIKRFLKSYESHAVIKHKNKTVQTSFSIGVSGFSSPGLDSSRDLIKAADEALYQSKSSGGNSCHTYQKK